MAAILLQQHGICAIVVLILGLLEMIYTKLCVLPQSETIQMSFVSYIIFPIIVLGKIVNLLENPFSHTRV